MIEFFLKKKLFLFTIIIFNFLIISNIYISPYFYILSLLVIFFNVFPLINFYYKYKEINYIPLFYFTHIYFFCCYSLAIFFPETIINIFDNSSFRNAISNGNLETTVISLIQKKKLFINALEIYVIGLVFFNFGNYIVKIAISDKTKKNVYFDINYNFKELLILGLVTYLFASIFVFRDNFELLNKIYQIKYPLIYLSILSIQLYLIFQKKRKIFLTFFLYVLIFFILYIELLDGSVSKSFLYLISLYLLSFLVTKNINFKAIFVIIILSFTIHTFKYEYRNVIWGEKNLNKSLSNYEYAKEQSSKKQNLINKSNNFIKTYSENLANISIKNKFINNKNFLLRNFSRLNHSFQSLIIVTALSPKKVPYWKGHSYKIFTTKFIPRIFWKNKPSDQLGNQFGTRYKILDKSNNTTSWNMPVLNEFYVNFGILGVILGMFLIGSTYKLVISILNYDKQNYLFLITFISLYPLFYLESHFSLTFGAVLQNFVFLLIYISIFKYLIFLIKRSM